MKYVVEMRDAGRWRSVRHVIPVSHEEALDLQGWLAKWELGTFRVVQCE